MAPSSRMLVLLSLLQARRDWPGRALAERLDISERTVRRDIDRLRELGYRISAAKGPDGGYRLDAGSELPPLLFDDEQAIVLAVALQTVAVTGTGFEEPAQRALAAVRQVMPARLRHRIDELRVVPVAAGSALAPVNAEVLARLGAAVRARQILRFEYSGGTGAATGGVGGDAATGGAGAGDAATGGVATGAAGVLSPLRRAEAHHVVLRLGRWYLVGWDLDRGDWRTFRVDRMRLRSHAGGEFAAREVPGGDVAAFVSARFQGEGDPAAGGGGIGGGWPCRGEVILAAAARDVAPFAGDALVEDLGPGRCRMVLGSWSWNALAAGLGRFDVEIEVVGPPELARACGHLARRFAAAAG
ncbi:helix-turn-helix transcriptional regulator [Subtercola sp. YIM 133946]|uniref:helix-turn-helix transcriptional regulator n=1 Tax=Subtercola sp. YIM 133946 TaxID=3118909 RepID=UPI002F9389B7